MKEHAKLIDHFAKVNDNYTITNWLNGFVVEVAGQDSNENWINAKFVFRSLEELVGVVKVLTTMNKA